MRFSFRLVLVALLASLPTGWLPAGCASECDGRLRETVNYLASDELQGRGVGSPGIDKAADFIAQQFSKLGLRTDLYNGTPFQEFEITLASELGPADTNRLSFVSPKEASGQTKPIELKLGDSFTPLAIGASSKFDLPLVFAGFGITAKD